MLIDTPDSPDCARLDEYLPSECIEQAVAQTGKASIRHRFLPVEQAGVAGRCPRPVSAID